MNNTEEVIKILKSLKRKHYECEDPWYNCPKSEEGCADERQDECNCSADWQNEMLDRAIALLK